MVAKTISPKGNRTANVIPFFFPAKYSQLFLKSFFYSAKTVRPSLIQRVISTASVYRTAVLKSECKSTPFYNTLQIYSQLYFKRKSEVGG